MCCLRQSLHEERRDWGTSYHLQNLVKQLIDYIVECINKSIFERCFVLLEVSREVIIVSLSIQGSMCTNENKRRIFDLKIHMKYRQSKGNFSQRRATLQRAKPVVIDWSRVAKNCKYDNPTFSDRKYEFEVKRDVVNILLWRVCLMLSKYSQHQ